MNEEEQDSTNKSPQTFVGLSKTNDFMDVDFDCDDSHQASADGSSSSEMDEDVRNMAEKIDRNLLRSSSFSSNGQLTTKYSRRESKKKRNTGKSYINSKGSVVAARIFEPLSRSCRKKCKEKFPEIAQEQVFNSYWVLGMYNQRILFVGNLMDISGKKTQSLKKHPYKPRNREYNINYNLEYAGKRSEVCQKCFRQCLGETESFLKSVVRKKLEHPQSSYVDHRGSGGGSNKFNQEIIERIKEHINSFPAYESHYSRRDTSCKYFHCSLTISQMYRLYCEKYKSQTVGLTTYSQVFKTMKIKFKQPKVDTCKTCDSIKMKIDIAKMENNIDTLKELENIRTLHHAKAELAYKSKQLDKGLAINDLEMKVYTFDLQQCLPTPHLNNAYSFYKRKLWTYNLTIHDCVTGRPHCYMWHEAMSGRGGNQIASCIFKHVYDLQKNSLALKRLIFYSDSCSGQNKNSFLCIMFLMAFQIHSNLELIDHKFLEPGHTHMECDSDHAAIERKKKRTEIKIHHPHDWYNFIRTVGSKRKFDVIEMEKKYFFNFSLFLKTNFMWRNRNEDTETFVWKDVKWLQYRKANFGKIFYKTTLDEQTPFKVLNIIKRGISTVGIGKIPNINEITEISSKKKKDLEDLLPFIDPSFHVFYKTLRTKETIDIHPDLVEDESDVE